jgi:hypothetical protein
MTVKKTNKPAMAKPSLRRNGYPNELTAQECLAVDIGNLVGQRDTINAEMDKKCTELRKMRKGKNIGTQSSDCAVMKRFLESQIARGLSENTIKNNCTTFRKAVNEGKPYDVNANRKAKGAQTAPKGSSASASSIRLEVKGEPKTEELSGAFRKFFNKLKGQDQYAQLASFLLDGLDEFDGE